MIPIGLLMYLITHLVIHFLLKIIRFHNNNNNNNSNSSNNNPSSLEHKLFIMHHNLVKYLQLQIQINNNSLNNNNNNLSKCQIFNKILISVFLLVKMDNKELNLIFHKILDLIKMIMMKIKIKVLIKIQIKIHRIINTQTIYLKIIAIVIIIG